MKQHSCYLTQAQRFRFFSFLNAPHVHFHITIHSVPAPTPPLSMTVVSRSFGGVLCGANHRCIFIGMSGHIRVHREGNFNLVATVRPNSHSASITFLPTLAFSCVRMMVKASRPCCNRAVGAEFGYYRLPLATPRSPTTHSLAHFLSLFLYIYMCVCVCRCCSSTTFPIMHVRLCAASSCCSLSCVSNCALRIS
uniref:Uncharacterized protein n=1 Tax=Trypanosoma vivax (strain Y486) TaxID=1055687 RepID=G0TZC4_TRYVY|nr:hypothetical protein TVY486_0706440 [Trypanosoma vivax Y486]